MPCAPWGTSLSTPQATDPPSHQTPRPPCLPARFLALTFRRRIQLVDVARGELVSPAPGCAGEVGTPIVGLAFSCDSATLLSLTRGGDVCMHSVPSGEIVPGEKHGRKALRAALQQLGGGLQGVSAHPTLPSVFLLHTSAGVSMVVPEPGHQGRHRPGPAAAGSRRHAPTLAWLCSGRGLRKPMRRACLGFGASRSTPPRPTLPRCACSIQASRPHQRPNAGDARRGRRPPVLRGRTIACCGAATSSSTYRSSRHPNSLWYEATGVLHASRWDVHCGVVWAGAWVGGSCNGCARPGHAILVLTPPPVPRPTDRAVMGRSAAQHAGTSAQASLWVLNCIMLPM